MHPASTADQDRRKLRSPYFLTITCRVAHALANPVRALAGGIGLFLLGMWLMTDGLRLAAGAALRDVLAHSTRTPRHALASGTMLTMVH